MLPFFFFNLEEGKHLIHGSVFPSFYLKKKKRCIRVLFSLSFTIDALNQLSQNALRQGGEKYHHIFIVFFNMVLETNACSFCLRRLCSNLSLLHSILD